MHLACMHPSTIPYREAAYKLTAVPEIQPATNIPLNMKMNTYENVIASYSPASFVYS
jgi:hypothetical protein